ncbi:MAG: hypothetical protein Q8L05_04510, partial [Actinomycetota bacterium]|nr:hypothetical protein [Actinomycetota bacterium]
MEEDLPVRSEYRSAMESLESAKRVAASGIDYWFAREIHAIFGYDSWSKFTPVIERAKEAMIASGIEPSHHIAQTSKM